MRTAVLAGLMLFLWAGGSLGHTVADLEAIASSEAILEISQAAGWALADVYAASKPAAELEPLTRSTSPGMVLAAREALRLLDDPLARLVAVAPEELLRLSREALSAAERLDASRAYFVATRADVTREELESAARADSEWALAAGEVLGGFYAAYRVAGVEALLELARDSPFAGMRRAASVALTALWVADGPSMTEDEIYTQIVRCTLWKPDLAAAYMGVLAHRFLEGLGS